MNLNASPRLIFALAILVWTLPSYALETRLAMNPRIDLNRLRGDGGQAQVSTDRDGSIYTVDASAVLNVVPSKLLAVSIDFDRHHQLGMPDVAEGHVVSRNGDQLFAWMHMSAIGTDSQQYLDVRALSGLSPSTALGAQWEMVHAAQVPGARYPDDPSFGRIEGSLYILPLGSGDAGARQPCYVRYFTQADVQSALPQFMISMFVRSHLGSDIQQGLRIMATQSQ